MKATELMIGDWFKTTYPNNRVEYRKVTSIYENGYVGCKECVTNAIEPIPITKEILEKNGWEHRPTGYVFHIDGGKSYDNTLWFIFNDNTFVVENAEFSIKYVHELQHALRLCEITKEIEL